MLRRLEPYWYAIILVFAIAAAVFGYHLLTGAMPPRAAVIILGLPIYWYAIWIITGVALGTWVVSRLAAERARRAFVAAVPADVRQTPVADAGLPDDVARLLAERKLNTLGDALYEVGLDPRRLGLKLPEQARVVEALAAAVTGSPADDVLPRNTPAVEVSTYDAPAAPAAPPSWFTTPPWRIWNPDHAWNALILMIILGLLGARLYHVLTPSPSMAAVGVYSALDYFRNPALLLNFRGGGLGIYGAIAGGLLAVILYTRRNRLPTLGWADLAVVGAALGQAVGRWGNFFNQELYGSPTDLPWAVFIDLQYRLPDLADFSYFHPAFLYESLWSLLTFFVLYRLARQWADRLLPGELLALYLVAYAVGRILLELVRLDSRAVAFLGLETGLAVATIVSIAVALAAIIAVVARRLSRRRRLSAA